MELLNEESIPMKWLSQDSSISYKTINNFRSSQHADNIIKTAFVYFTMFLSDNNLIKDEALFIDGTKVEADANKYSFTWRKAVDKFQPKLKEKVVTLYNELIEKHVVQEMSDEYLTTSDGVADILKQTTNEIEILDSRIAKEPKVIPGGSKNKRKRRRLKKLARTLKTDYLPRIKKYEDDQNTFQGRNSFSKTDHDATFMRMKEDPMLNGQLKPGYNLQAASNGQFVLNYGVFSNPTDTRTLIPFLSSMHHLELFKYIVADAGYGSESNYSAIVDHFNKVPLIPYGMMEKEKKRKFKNDPTKLQNWDYNAELDYYTDNQGVKFSFKNYSIRHDKYGFERKFKIYEADKTQANSELDVLAKTSGG
ncbi:transposase, partial [Pediococcus argentinicus]|nr:transposase [Pediococcus argentinicus]